MKRRALLLLIALLAAWTGPVMAGGGHVIDDGVRASYLFVLSGTSASFRDGQLTLSGVPLVVYFSDRPYRIAGHLAPDAFADVWTQGADGLAGDPPNASLAAPGGDLPPAVIEIMDFAPGPDNTIHMNINVLQGEIPADMGACSLFIDSTTMKTPGVY